MKRTMIRAAAVVCAMLLLSGCWPYWHDGGHHRHYYDGDHGGQEYHRY